MEIVCLCFWVIHSYDDVTIAGIWLQNLDLYFAFEKLWVFNVPHSLWHEASGFEVSSE